MAVTYTIRKCKGRKYGVYVKALSGIALKQLAHRMPELETIPDKGAIQVNSNRIARYSTKDSAQRYINKIKKETEDTQIKRIGRLFMLPTDKDYEVSKLQYFKFIREFNGHTLQPFTTLDKQKVENLALLYSDDNTNAGYKRTRTTFVKAIPSDMADLKANGEVKREAAKGIKGMMKDFKDQKNEFCNRLNGRRKRTTKLSFFQKYR